MGKGPNCRFLGRWLLNAVNFTSKLREIRHYTNITSKEDHREKLLKITSQKDCPNQKQLSMKQTRPESSNSKLKWVSKVNILENKCLFTQNQWIIMNIVQLLAYSWIKAQVVLGLILFWTSTPVTSGFC